MNVSRLLIFLTDIFCIAALALGGTTALRSSGVYTGLQSLLEKINQPASANLHLIILGLLLLLGLLTVIWKNSSGQTLAVVALLLSLPAIFSFNEMPIFSIVGADVNIPDTLTFPSALAIGLLILTAWWILDMTSMLKKEGLTLTRSRASEPDINSIRYKNHLWVYLIAAGVLLFALAVAALAAGLQQTVSRGLNVLSWWIIPLALAAVFILGVYLYWIATR
jgi:hypothetical protein